jgi:hypothetical protein
MRQFQGAADSEKWDALEKFQIKLKANLSPEKKPSQTNTIIDYQKIVRKNAVYLKNKSAHSPGFP